MTGALANVIGLVGITAGTLYQKRHGGGTNLRWGAAFQLCGAAGLLWILTLFFETGTIIWSAPFIASLV